MPYGMPPSPEGEGIYERRNIMDFSKVPIGFGMALAQNYDAMSAYSAMPDDQKQTVLSKARNVRSEQEMYTLVASLGSDRWQ